MKHYHIHNLFFLIILLVVLSGCKGVKKVTSSHQNQQKVFIGKEKIKHDKFFIDANKEKILGNYERARELFLDCIRINGSNDAAMYEAARIDMNSGKLNDASFYITAAIIINPKNKWYQELYANILTKKGKHKEAAKIYEQLIENYPNEYQYYFNLSYSLSNAKDWQAAIKVYDLLEKITGVGESISFRKQKLYLKLDKLDKAVDEMKRLIDAFPYESRYYGLLAELYAANGYEEKTFEVYQSMLELDPDNPHAHLSLADYYQKKGDRGKYIEEIKIAFKNPDLNIDRKIQIMISYFNLIETKPEIKEEPLILSKILLKAHPEEAKAYAIYGDFLYNDNQLEAAIQQYKIAIQLDNSKFTVWQQMLFIHAELERYDSLIAVADKALAYFPNQPVIYYLKGIALSYKNEHEQSISVLKNGVELNSDNTDLLARLYASLGEAYYKTENYIASDSCFDHSLTYDPKNALVLNNYSYYLSLRENQLDKAKDMSKKANVLSPDNASYEDTYGWIMYKLENYKESKIWLEKAMSHEGDKRHVILEHYGDVLFQLGDSKEAVKYWMKAKELGSKSKLIDRKIADEKLYE